MIKKSLNKEDAETTVNALVTPHLDYGNAPLYGINGKYLRNLQIALLLLLTARMHPPAKIVDDQSKPKCSNITPPTVGPRKDLFINWKVQKNNNADKLPG